jgi:hypothetical protein
VPPVPAARDDAIAAAALFARALGVPVGAFLRALDAL